MTSVTRPRKTHATRPCVHAFVFVLVMLSIALNNANAYAAGHPSAGIRVAKALEKFDEVRQYATIFKLRPPRRLHSRHLALVTGGLPTRSQTRAFVSLGKPDGLPAKRAQRTGQSAGALRIEADGTGRCPADLPAFPGAPHLAP